MQVGDIYLVDLPQKGGHEQEGRRPVIIVVINTDVPMSMVIPLTTSDRAKSFEKTMMINPDDNNNLSQPSIALIFQMLAIDNRRFQNRIGKLSNNVLEELKGLIRNMFV